VSGIVGNLRTLGPVRSEFLGNERPVYVWLPSSYSETDDRSYPVLYMHDGQNLFSDDVAFGREWQVDEQMTRLATLGLEAIIVGIPNAGEQRMTEYSPFCDADGNAGRGDQYLRFLFDEVMPLVQSTVRVTHAREMTGNKGSSLGALIGLYAFFRHPERFGYVGAMSPALWFNDCALLDKIEQASFVEGRIYLDIGTAEGDEHLAHIQQLHGALLRKGYRPGETLFYVEEDHAAHDEDAWARRLRTALYFLLPCGPQDQPSTSRAPISMSAPGRSNSTT
jgi:predicted alpha/beta superfamily hydrolase